MTSLPPSKKRARVVQKACFKADGKDEGASPFLLKSNNFRVRNQKTKAILIPSAGKALGLRKKTTRDGEGNRY